MMAVEKAASDPLEEAVSMAVTMSVSPLGAEMMSASAYPMADKDQIGLSGGMVASSQWERMVAGDREKQSCDEYFVEGRSTGMGFEVDTCYK